MTNTDPYSGLHNADLRKQLESPFPGVRHVADELRRVPMSARPAIVSAGHIMANTTPGWRTSDAIGHYVAAYLRNGDNREADALTGRESDRRKAEKALNADPRAPRRLLDWSGVVRRAADAMGETA